jgi:membrane protease YdiL (CAAX protease family)
MAVSSESGGKPEKPEHARRLRALHPAAMVAIACGVLMLANAALVALPSGWDVLAAIVGSAGVVALGRWRQLSWRQMGLGSKTWRSGVRWGAASVGLVAVFYALVVLLPVTRDVSNDLAPPAGSSVWATSLLLIPLRTVILEELTFRGVLWGLLDRRAGPRWALYGSALAFGCWHVAPALSLADRTDGGIAVSILGVLVFTTLAGLVFGEMRRRSGSVIAPAALHWAANGLGLLAVYLA